MKKRLMLLLLTMLLSFTLVPSASAEHVLNPPSGKFCKTVGMAVWHYATTDWVAEVFSYDITELRHVETYIPFQKTRTTLLERRHGWFGIAGWTWVGHPTTRYITSVDINTLDPHSVSAWWLNCIDA